MPVHVGANSLKKPHHIIILRFSEVVKGHAKCVAHEQAFKKHKNLIERVPFSELEKILYVI